VATWLGSLAVIALIFQVGIWGNALLRAWAADYRRRNEEQLGGARVTTLNAILFVARLALFSVVALLALDNVPGVNVTALVASLGIGGIAVALALQNVLADLFASLTITLDKPFVIGDFVIIDSYLGSVEHIGLKTTRIRSLGGEQLVFSNNDLLTSRIRNYGRMQKRRVVFEFGVLYQTTADQLEAIPGEVRAILADMEQVWLDRVHFKSFGDSSLVFEVVYYVDDPDYNLYMDKQQEINLALVRRLADLGVEFAYPTRTIHLAGGSQLVTARPAPASPDPGEAPEASGSS
jgi:small-conductance mechanosensitive channel